MDEKVKFRLYRMSVWCGVLVLIASTVSFTVVGQLTPPPSPTLNAEEMSQFLISHRSGILWCTVIMGIFVPFFYAFAVITSLQMRRIEGGWGLLSMVQLTTAVVAPTGWIYPLAVLSTAVYRPGRDPEQMLALSDQYWLTYVGIAVIFCFNLVSIGISAFVDRRPKPIFPRWFGYLNFILAIALFPGVFVYVAMDGPFAWDGIFTNIIPSIAFIVWKVAMIVVLLRAVKSEEQETLGREAIPATA